MRRRHVFSGIMSFVVVLFSSCIGVHTDITIRNNGTGTMELEYRISRLTESLGKLDGNENWPTLPVGRADFERTVDRIEGLTLTAFTVRDDEEDLVMKVSMAFSNLEALCAFFDSSGQQALVSREGGADRLSLALGGGSQIQDPELLELTGVVFQGYTMGFGFTFPREAALSLTDGAGRNIELPPAGDIQRSGRNVRFSAPMADLLSLAEPFVMEFRW